MSSNAPTRPATFTDMDVEDILYAAAPLVDRVDAGLIHMQRAVDEVARLADGLDAYLEELRRR